MSFISNALKNLFNLLGQKTPTNNGVTSSDLVPLLNSSHAPKGDVSITDLASVLGGQQTHISTNSDLNDYVNCGVYQVDNSSDAKSITNSPYSNSGYSLIVIPSGSNRIQIIIANNGLAWYSRGNVSNEWKSWYKLEGTVIQQ